MDNESLELDENGIPILRDAVTLEELGTAPDLGDPELIERLLQEAPIQQMLDDVTEDLQKMVAWKIETLLKEEFSRIVKDVTEQSAARLSQDIHTQLQLALPELLAKIAEQAK